MKKSFYIWVISLVLILTGIVFLFGQVLLPFLVGGVIAYLLNPLCLWLERKGMSRTIATSFVTLSFFIGFFLFCSFFIPLLIWQIKNLITHFSNYMTILDGYMSHINDLLWRYLGVDLVRENQWAEEYVRKYLSDFMSWFMMQGGHVAHGINTVVGWIVIFVLTPFVTFYLLRDFPHITSRLKVFFPVMYQSGVLSFLREVDDVLSAFIRGQLIVCSCMALFYSITLSMVGLHFGFLIGLVTGFLIFIPYLGMFSGCVAAYWIALSQYHSFMPFVLLACVFIAGQILEGYIITPRFVGGRVGLHPVLIIFAFLGGAHVFGVVGIFFSIPIAAVIGVIVRTILRQYFASSFYKGCGKET